MSGTASATVEVLRAEVRALMVGSRQVTLSVYRQLDWVTPEGIEPFGRVCDRADDAGPIYVVGRCASDGSLVRAAVTAAKTWRPLLTEYVVLSSTGINYGRLEVRFHVDGVLCEGWVNWGAERTRTLPSGTWAWRSAEAKQAVVDQFRAFLGQSEIADTWRSLPLIVLAGLR